MRKLSSQSSDRDDTEIEGLLRQHFEATQADTSEIDFRAMARRATQTNTKVSVIRQRRTLLSRTAYTTCACLAVALIGRISFYFAPNWQQVTYAAARQIPGLQSVIPKWDVGLLNESSAIHTMNASATNRGMSLYVTAAYADSARTVIFLKSRWNAGSGFLRPESFTLTDQFGHQYTEVPPIGSSSVPSDGSWVGSMDFEGIPHWKQATGLRLKLNVTSMIWSSNKANSTRTVRGHWTINWVQPTTSVGQSHWVSIEKGSFGIPVRLSQVQLAPSATVFDLSLNGAKYNSPTFGYVERVSDGKKYELLGGAAPYQIVTAPLTSSGKYLLIITTYDKQNVRWKLPFTLRK